MLSNNELAPFGIKYPSNDEKLFDVICSVNSLKAAWFELKSRPGMMTPGSGSETINKISQGWFEKTSEELLKGTFEYPKNRKVRIQKKGKETKRSITISNPRTKIIEKAFLMTLEPIFEGV